MERKLENYWHWISDIIYHTLKVTWYFDSSVRL